MRKIAIGAAFMAGIFLNTACATITRGTTEAFEVRTMPSGASVSTSLGKACAPTPCVLPKVSREADFTVTIEKDGYKTGVYNVTHETSGGGGAGMAGNIVFGGGIGAIVDANNGATQQLVPNPLVVELEKIRDPDSSNRDFIESVADDLLDRAAAGS